MRSQASPMFVDRRPGRAVPFGVGWSGRRRSQALPEGRLMNRRLVTAVSAATLLIGTLLPAASAAEPTIERPLTRTSTEPAPILKLDRSLLGERGRISVVIRLATDPVATVRGNAAQRARGTAVSSLRFMSLPSGNA